MVGAGPRRSLRGGQLIHSPLQPYRQSPRVTQQRHPQPVGGEPPGLLHRQPRLPGARPAQHLHPLLQPQQVQHPRLPRGEQLARRRPLVHLISRDAGDEVDLRALRPGERSHQRRGVCRPERPGRRLQTVELAAQPLRQAAHLILVGDQLAWAFGDGERLGQSGERQHHVVHHPRVATRPARVPAQHVAHPVLAGERLAHRVDPSGLAPLAEPPVPVGIADVPALDLDDGDSDPGPHDHGVGFPVAALVGQAQVDQHGGAVGQLVPEGAQDQGLRGADPVFPVRTSRATTS